MTNFIFLVIGIIIANTFYYINKGFIRHRYLSSTNEKRWATLIQPNILFAGFVVLFGLTAIYLLVRSITLDKGLYMFVGLGYILNALLMSVKIQFIMNLVRPRFKYIRLLQSGLIVMAIMSYVLHQIDIYGVRVSYGEIELRVEEILNLVTFPRSPMSTILLTLHFYADASIIYFQYTTLSQSRYVKDKDLLKVIFNSSLIMFSIGLFISFGLLYFTEDISVFLSQIIIILGCTYFFAAINKPYLKSNLMSFSKKFQNKSGEKLVLVENVSAQFIQYYNLEKPFLNRSHSLEDVVFRFKLDEEQITKLIVYISGLEFKKFMTIVRLAYLIKSKHSSLIFQSSVNDVVKSLGFASTFEFQKEVLVTFGVSYKALMYDPKKFIKHLHKSNPWLIDFHFQQVKSKKKIRSTKI